MGQNQCPACSATAIMGGDANKDVDHINCPSCRPYAIAGIFHSLIQKGKLSKRDKEFVQYDMADYIKEERPEIVGSLDTDGKAYQYYSKRKKQRQNLQSGPLRP